LGKGKLYLIGLGLSPDLITLRGLRIAKSAAKVFVDAYTSALVDEGIKEIKELLNREVIPLRRKDLEEFSVELFKLVSKGLKIALLVPGNPLVATTHISLIVESAKRGLKYEVIPAPGIIPNAITMSGLMIYKLGKPVTITYPVNGVYSEFPYDVVKSNDARNLHSLLLLEMDAEKGIMMTIKEAIDIMQHLEELRGEGVFEPGRKAVAVSSLGSSQQRICFSQLSELAKLPPHPGPHTLIITSPKLHFMEEEALKVITDVYCR